jgi:hypothetical protein
MENRYQTRCCMNCKFLVLCNHNEADNVFEFFGCNVDKTYDEETSEAEWLEENKTELDMVCDLWEFN